MKVGKKRKIEEILWLKPTWVLKDRRKKYLRKNQQWKVDVIDSIIEYRLNR